MPYENYKILAIISQKKQVPGAYIVSLGFCKVNCVYCVVCPENTSMNIKMFFTRNLFPSYLQFQTKDEVHKCSDSNLCTVFQFVFVTKEHKDRNPILGFQFSTHYVLFAVVQLCHSVCLILKRTVLLLQCTHAVFCNVG
jgi:hypothetical protein